MTGEVRDVQLQVALAALVVFDVVDDAASAGFDEANSAPKDAGDEEGIYVCIYVCICVFKLNLTLWWLEGMPQCLKACTSSKKVRGLVERSKMDRGSP